MAVIVRKKRGTGDGMPAPAAAGPGPKIQRLRPTFVYAETFDTQALGERLLETTRLTVWKGFAAIAFDWSVIVATVWAVYAIAARSPQAFWPLWLVAVFVVGGRMHALLIIMHDSSHQRLHPNRVWNDRIANWLCAFPAGVGVEAYRKEHLIHHFYVNSEKDPNWILKKGDPEWKFPMSKGRLAFIFLKEFLGFGLLRILRYLANYGKHSTQVAVKKGEGRSRLLERLAYYALAATAITLLHGWATVALFWLVPLFSILPAILRMRILSEHHGLPWTNDLDHSRNYHATLLERVFIAPHDIHLHLVHHLFPAIPFYNVRRAHELLMEIPEYRDGQAKTDGILSPWRLSVIQDLTAAENKKALSPAPA